MYSGGTTLLAILEGLPYDAIAKHTGVSVGTVKSRVSRGRDTLEHLLLKDERGPGPHVDRKLIGFVAEMASMQLGGRR